MHQELYCEIKPGGKYKEPCELISPTGGKRCIGYVGFIVIPRMSSFAASVCNKKKIY